MLRCYSFLLMAAALFPLCLSAQRQRPLIDSLEQRLTQDDLSLVEQVETLNALGWQYRRVNIDSGMLYLAQAEEMLYGRLYDTLHFQHDYNLGTLLRYQGDYPTSAAILTRCVDFAEEAQDTLRLGNANYAIAIARLENQEYAVALEHVQRARSIFQLLGIADRELGALNVMATVLKDSNNFPEAERIYLQAIELALSLGNEYQLEAIYNNLAYNYDRQKEHELALEYFRKSLVINEKRNDQSGIAISKGNIANTLTFMERFAEAKPYLEEAIRLRTAMGVEEDVIGYKGRLGALNMYLGQQNIGLAQLEENLILAKERGYKNEVENILDHLVESTYHSGMYEVSARYFREYLAFVQERHGQVLSTKVNELNAKYKKAEQDQRIAILSTTNQLQESRLSRQRLLLYGGSLALFIFGALLFAIYRLYRQNSRKNQELGKALSEKEVLLKEIHHRVKNNLQVISSLLNLQAYRVKDAAALDALREGRARVQSMSLIHQSLYRKDHLTGVDVSKYLPRLCESLLATYKVNESNIQLQTNIEPITLDIDSIVPLGLIINELLTNALKYAFPDNSSGQIDIQITELAEGLELIVKDNGIGIANVEEVQQGDSFGYELIQAFRQKLDADLEIESQNGTYVRLLVRTYQKAA